MQYIVDENGIKTSVVVPYHLWEKMNSDYIKLRNKLDVLLAIRNGLGEIKTAKKKYEEFQTISDFLNESNG